MGIYCTIYDEISVVSQMFSFHCPSAQLLLISTSILFHTDFRYPDFSLESIHSIFHSPFLQREKISSFFNLEKFEFLKEEKQYCLRYLHAFFSSDVPSKSVMPWKRKGLYRFGKGVGGIRDTMYDCIFIIPSNKGGSKMEDCMRILQVAVSIHPLPPPWRFASHNSSFQFSHFLGSFCLFSVLTLSLPFSWFFYFLILLPSVRLYVPIRVGFFYYECDLQNYLWRYCNN